MDYGIFANVSSENDQRYWILDANETLTIHFKNTEFSDSCNAILYIEAYYYVTLRVTLSSLKIV